MSRLDRNKQRLRVHRRLRKRVHGDSARPRLAVYRSLHHIYVQAIDDDAGSTVAAASTTEKELRASPGGTVDAARKVGELIGRRLKDRGVEAVVFDRGGYIYHGRVKALADGARAAGLQF